MSSAINSFSSSAGAAHPPDCVRKTGLHNRAQRGQRTRYWGEIATEDRSPNKAGYHIRVAPCINAQQPAAGTTPANHGASRMNTARDPVRALPAALAQFDNLPDSAHVRLPIVSALNGISDPTVWRWVKSGRLPQPVKLGPNTTGWRVGELRRALAGA